MWLLSQYIFLPLEIDRMLKSSVSSAYALACFDHYIFEGAKSEKCIFNKQQQMFQKKTTAVLIVVLLFWGLCACFVDFWLKPVHIYTHDVLMDFGKNVLYQKCINLKELDKICLCSFKVHIFISVFQNHMFLWHVPNFCLKFKKCHAHLLNNKANRKLSPVYLLFNLFCPYTGWH